MRLALAADLGGAFGAFMRYLVYVALGKLGLHGFPYATLVVNTAGSFAMGAFIEGSALRWSISLELRTLVAVGILGGFTTFSTFALDVAILYERGRPFLCAIYIAASFLFSVGGMFLGMVLTRRMLV